MTAHVRIKQHDVECAARVALKAMEKSGKPARVVMDLRNERIEIILGESGLPIQVDPNEWTDDDV